MLQKSCYFTLVILFIATFVFFSSCESCEEKKPSKVVFVLFDLSGSTRLEPIRQKYLDDFSKILSNISFSDRIIADFITENPIAQSSFPVNTEFKSFDSFSDNKLIFEKKLENKKEDIKNTISKIVFNLDRIIYTTKILESLQLAERVFKIYKKDHKVLVLFSDMIEESAIYNFNKANLSKSQRDKIINQIKSLGTLSDLSGVKVYVVGAGAGTYNRMNIKKMSAIQDFWIDYFDACGAVLKKELYGGPLIGFEE